MRRFPADIPIFLLFAVALWLQIPWRGARKETDVPSAPAPVPSAPAVSFVDADFQKLVRSGAFAFSTGFGILPKDDIYIVRSVPLPEFPETPPVPDLPPLRPLFREPASFPGPAADGYLGCPLPVGRSFPEPEEVPAASGGAAVLSCAPAGIRLDTSALLAAASALPPAVVRASVEFSADGLPRSVTLEKADVPGGNAPEPLFSDALPKDSLPELERALYRSLAAPASTVTVARILLSTGTP